MKQPSVALPIIKCAEDATSARIASLSPAMTSLLLFVAVVALTSCAHRKTIPLIKSFDEAMQLVKSGVGSPRLAIIQGPTTAEQTQIAILHKAEDQIEADLGRDVDGLINWLSPSERNNQTTVGSTWQVSQLTFRGLKPQDRYVLRLMSLSKDLLDMREIASLDTMTKSVRFAVASCMDDSYLADSEEIWSDLVSHNPKFIVFLGDNVYTDMAQGKPVATDPKVLWERYAETRNAIPLFRFSRLVPVIATWDDHDYGVNDGDRNYPFKADAKRTFAAFFPQHDMGGFYENGDGVSSAFSGWGQQFILMDGRSFRSPTVDGKSSDAKLQTHWGKTQEDWLFKKLKKDAPPTWLFSGDQFFGKYHSFDSYEGKHPQSFSRFLGELKKNKPNIVFVSGDRHLTELMEIAPSEFGVKTYELTTGPIHGKTFPNAWEKTPNPRKIEGASGIVNFAIIDSEAAPMKGLEFRVSAFGLDKRALFDRKLSVGK